MNVYRKYYTIFMIECQYIYMNVLIGGVEMAHYPRLKDLREDNDLTQKQVAEFLLITQQQYSLYEKGYRDIPTEYLISLADFYKTSVDYIVGRTNNSKSVK